MSVPQVRHPLPRAPEAVSDRAKWTDWILASRGHGEDWSAVFGVGLDDADRIWELLRLAVRGAPVTAIRDRGQHGLVCEVRLGSKSMAVPQPSSRPGTSRMRIHPHGW